MRQGDLSPVVTTLVEAADPEKVSAAALAAYALEASRAPAAREIALVASLAPTPLDPPEVIGVVGVLLSDDLFPAEMRLRGSDAAYVTNLAVASRARRRGVASDLLGAAERFASESGRRTVWCRVDDDNHTARGMYERRGYAPREPPRLAKYRRVVSSAYGFAGLVHFVDLVFGSSACAIAAGAPSFAEMTMEQKILALLWCALGPASTACDAAARRKKNKKISVAGLVAYGAFETALACSCAVWFGARGGDAATGAVAVQAVVFACYKALAPGARGGKITLAKTVSSTGEPPRFGGGDADERFASLFLGFVRVRASDEFEDDAFANEKRRKQKRRAPRTLAAASKKKNGSSNAARDPRVDDGWVADIPEPPFVTRDSVVAETSVTGKSTGEDGDDSDPAQSRSPSEDYERDASGRVVYAARGFFYDGVRPSDGADYGMTERVKVAVGIVGRKRERVFALRKTLGSVGGVAGVNSEVFAVTMDRPLGVVVERDTDGRVRVADFVEGSRAGRAAAVAQLQGLNENAGARAPKRGDVVRAFTTTTLSYGPRAQLLGDLSGTKRAVVLFGADDQPWGKTIGALKSGLVADGAVTLILERDLDPARAAAWTPERTPDPEEETRRSETRLRASNRRRENETLRGVSSQSSPRLRTVGGTSEGKKGTADHVGDGRERVSQATSGVPDPVNASLVVAGASFLLLIVTGFS